MPKYPCTTTRSKTVSKGNGKLGTSQLEGVEDAKNTVRVDERGDERGGEKREGRGGESVAED